MTIAVFKSIALETFDKANNAKQIRCTVEHLNECWLRILFSVEVVQNRTERFIIAIHRSTVGLPAPTSNRRHFSSTRGHKLDDGSRTNTCTLSTNRRVLNRSLIISHSAV